MTTKQPIFQRLPILLATGVLSTGLLISGCSNNETAETATDNEDVAATVDTSEDVTLDNDTTDQAMNEDSASGTDEITDSAEDKTAIDSDNVNPVTDATKQKSLVTNPTQVGTPEDTVKQALNSLYYGDVKDAASYYQVDMANFEEELANTQSAFQQTVDGVTITDTKYNDDKTRATITGELMLKGQSEPAPLTYQLQKIEGQWKILG
jgi:outer membrane murein-binding lipoprotein Lpp